MKGLISIIVRMANVANCCTFHNLFLYFLIMINHFIFIFGRKLKDKIFINNQSKMNNETFSLISIRIGAPLQTL